jgi:hypothetical protein
MKNIKKYQISLMYILFLVVHTAQSQDFAFEDDVQDVPAAPIDNWVAPAVFITILLVFLYQKKLKFNNH